MTETQRIDKWLWHARVARTRSAAAELVTGGHVRLNRKRVGKPGHAVRAGDVVTVAIGNRVLVLRIIGMAPRRGSASVARELYEDLSPPPLPKASPDAMRLPGAGRPTKRERRELEAWKRGISPPGESGE